MNPMYQEWEKEGHTIKQDILICLCGGFGEYLGSAGCSHDDDITYFYQCAKCKKLDLSQRSYPRITEAELEKAGWKLSDTKTNEK